MNDKYRNKYRIASARLQSWNYGWDAAYFVTICTKDRAHHFGEVVKGKMQLSPVGAIADVLWHEIKHHARHVELDAFVVMPNHVHGIIILNGNEADAVSSDTGFDGDGADGDGADVETGHALSLRHQYSNQTPESTPLPPPIGRDRFQNQGKNTLSSIVGSYKSAVTKHANRLGLAHGWQVRFHDHIIRDQASFDRIQAYIINNPRNWLDDKFNGK